jgi:hypothetical protein|tara:strand:+ start:721 stop:1092 length:372 start_codon:yes stop_codon:yes gene_type:complete
MAPKYLPQCGKHAARTIATTLKGIDPMIYIATDTHGRGVSLISAFENKYDFWTYAAEVTAAQEAVLLESDTIDDICDKLYDTGMGTGARHHYRVTRAEAAKHIKDGAVGKVRTAIRPFREERS